MADEGFPEETSGAPDLFADLPDRFSDGEHPIVPASSVIEQSSSPTQSQPVEHAQELISPASSDPSDSNVETPMILEGDLREMIRDLEKNPDPEQIRNLVALSADAEIPIWIQFISSLENDAVLEVILQNLGGLRAPQITPYLVNFLQMKNPKVRAAAVESLQGNGDVDAIPSLTPLLEDPDPQVR